MSGCAAAAGLVLEPLPTGAWAFLAVTVAIFTKTLTFAAAFSAFCNDVIWLIVVSFFFAKVSLLEHVVMLASYLRVMSETQHVLSSHHRSI